MKMNRVEESLISLIWRTQITMTTFFNSLEIYFFFMKFPSFVCVSFYFVANNINNLESNFPSMFIYYRIYTFFMVRVPPWFIIISLTFCVFMLCVCNGKCFLFIDLNSFCLIIIFFFTLSHNRTIGFQYIISYNSELINYL